MTTIRHLLFFTFFAISISASSQFNKGDRLIGGGVNVNWSGYNYSDASYPSNSNSGYYTGVTPRYSWVTKDNRMNGIFLRASYNSTKSTAGNPSSDQTSYSYDIGAGYFIRQFKDFSQQFGWFLEYNGVGSYNYSRNDAGAQPNKNKGFSLGLNVVPGIYYKASSRAAIEASFGGVGVSYSKATSNLGGTSKRFSAGLGFPSNFTLGFQFQLHNKQSSKG